MHGNRAGYLDVHNLTRTKISDPPAEFSDGKNNPHSRCDYVCGGFTGLHRSGKWSTWSPGRFSIPDKDEEFYPALVKNVGRYLQRPKPELTLFNVLMPGDKLELTCGNCQLICHPDKDIRKQRYKMLVESGVILQNPDGSLEAFSPEEAAQRLEAMDPKKRTLYEEV
jgi:epoxyqueuosine reductase QueG